MNKVELIPAFEWTCDNCGERNFASGVVPEFSEEEQAELREENGIEADDLGSWLMIPATVKCADCEVEYETVHFGDDGIG